MAYCILQFKYRTEQVERTHDVGTWTEHVKSSSRPALSSRDVGNPTPIHRLRRKSAKMGQLSWDLTLDILQATTWSAWHLIFVGCFV